MGSKIDRKGIVEQELEIQLGAKGEGRETIPVSHWWLVLKEHFILHLLVSPIEICEILTEWNQEIRQIRQKLRIGNTGNAGPGNPEINALVGAIDGIVGNNSIGEMRKGLGNKGAMAESHRRHMVTWEKTTFTHAR